MTRPSLMNLAIKYFTRRGYDVKKGENNEVSPSFPEFDLIVSKRMEVYPVRVKDWNRTVGVNIVIRLDKACQAARFSTPILVAGKFSEHARAYASRRGIMLITKSEINRSLI